MKTGPITIISHIVQYDHADLSKTEYVAILTWDVVNSIVYRLKFVTVCVSCVVKLGKVLSKQKHLLATDKLPVCIHAV